MCKLLARKFLLEVATKNLHTQHAIIMLHVLRPSEKFTVLARFLRTPHCIHERGGEETISSLKFKFGPMFVCLFILNIGRFVGGF